MGARVTKTPLGKSLVGVHGAFHMFSDTLVGVFGPLSVCEMEHMCQSRFRFTIAFSPPQAQFPLHPSSLATDNHSSPSP